MHPCLKECDWCGHSAGEHRLNDRITPARSECMLCPCADFNHGPDRLTGAAEIKQILEDARKPR